MSEGKTSTENLLQFRRKHFLPAIPTYHPSAPVQLVRAQGHFVWDEAGRQYLDCIGGIVCISAGHNHPKIKKALQALMAEDAIQHTSVVYLSRFMVEAAETLLKEAPAKLDRVHFSSSGSEANELAFTAARHATGEQTIIHLRHSYHGATQGAHSVCGHNGWRFRAQPVASVVTVPEPNCYRCPYGKAPSNCSLECAKAVEATIQTATHGKIAGMIVEPVMGVGGFITPPDEYFKEVTRIVHQYGGKYISDEVQTGAGRCGDSLLLSKSLGIDCDMITMAKGIGNGAPVGATLLTSEIAETMAGKLYFNTFGGDPYQMVQMKLTMDIIREEGLIENAQAMSKLLVDGLKQLANKHAIIGDVRGRGLLLGIELVKDRETKEYAPQETARFMDLCKDKGLLVGKGGLFGNVIRLTPPLTIGRAEVDSILKTMDESFYGLAAR